MRRGPPLIKNSTEGRPYWDLKGGKNAPGGGEKRLKKRKKELSTYWSAKLWCYARGKLRWHCGQGLVYFTLAKHLFIFCLFFPDTPYFLRWDCAAGFWVVWWIFVACGLGLFYIFVLLLKPYCFSWRFLLFDKLLEVVKNHGNFLILIGYPLF